MAKNESGSHNSFPAPPSGEGARGSMSAAATVPGASDVPPLSKPQIFLVRMGLFLLLFTLICVLIWVPIFDAFMGNIFINALIVAVLVFAAVYSFVRVVSLYPETDWVNAFRRGDASLKPPRKSGLLSPMATMFRDRRGPLALDAGSTRIILDSIGARLDESRENTRYLGNLLLFLGILGTFWGLSQSVGTIKDVLGGLSVGAGDAEGAFEELQTNLSGPLVGLATAVSSSLFGIAGSLIVGFLGLQATQAQNRFYNDIEEWLSTLTTIEGLGSGPGAAPAQAAARSVHRVESAGLGEQGERIIEAFDAMREAMEKADEQRRQTEDWLIQTTQNLSDLDSVIRAQKDLLSGIAGVAQEVATQSSTRGRESLDLLHHLNAHVQQLAGQAPQPAAQNSAQTSAQTNAQPQDDSAPPAPQPAAPAFQSRESVDLLRSIHDVTTRLMVLVEDRVNDERDLDGQQMSLLSSIDESLRTGLPASAAPRPAEQATYTPAMPDLGFLDQRFDQLIAVNQQSDERLTETLRAMRDLAAQMVSQASQAQMARSYQPMDDGASHHPVAPAMDAAILQDLNAKVGQILEYAGRHAEGGDSVAVLRHMDETMSSILRATETIGGTDGSKSLGSIAHYTQELAQLARGSSEREILEALRSINQIAHSMREGAEEGRNDLVQELRAEMKILTKTIAALIIEGRRHETRPRGEG